MRINIVQTTCCIVLVFSLIVIQGCTNTAPPPVTPDLCQDGVVRIDSTEPEQNTNGPVTVKVSGFDGVECDTLEQPLAAMNWFIYPANQADIDSLAAYNARMLSIVRSYGTRLLFGGSDTEPLIEAETMLEPADHIELPLYGHAEAFARMTTSQEYQETAPLKNDLEFESYSFVFQECVVGCDTLAGFPLPNIRPPAIVFQLAIDDDPYNFGEEDRNTMRSLIMNVDKEFAADYRYKLAYGGVSVAHPTLLMSDGTEVLLFKANGIDATLIVVPTIGTDVAGVLDTDLLAPIFNQALSVAAIKVH
jgi:uncharacterized protein (DUF1330 family)